MAQTITRTETGIEITITTADSADADIRERRFAARGARAAVELVISVSGVSGLAIGYAMTKNGRTWSPGPRRTYRDAAAGRRAADQQWSALLARLGAA